MPRKLSKTDSPADQRLQVRAAPVAAVRALFGRGLTDERRRENNGGALRMRITLVISTCFSLPQRIWQKQQQEEEEEEQQQQEQQE